MIVLTRDTNQMTKTRQVALLDLGLIEYNQAWQFQQERQAELVDAKRNEHDVPHHYLILCQHPPVYTLGKSGKPEHLLINESGLAARGATFEKINRGGDITFHGPGQLVVYPILDLDHFFTDVHRYVRYLEEVVIRTLRTYRIEAKRIAEYTGVWLDTDDSALQKKICAIGVHLTRWVTLHGLALNANTDLSFFNYIIPCGITDDQKAVTSIQQVIGREVSMDELKKHFIRHFSDVFECSIENYETHDEGYSHKEGA